MRCAPHQFWAPVSGSNFGIGWPVLGSNLAPLGWIGWPVLGSNLAPLSWIGWPVLGSNMAPLGWIGWPVLGSNMAPLGWIGWPVLGSNMAPLGWGVTSAGMDGTGTAMTGMLVAGLVAGCGCAAPTCATLVDLRQTLP